MFTLDFLSPDRDRIKPPLEVGEGTPVPDTWDVISFGDNKEYTVERRIFEYARVERGADLSVYLVCTPRKIER